MLFEVLKNRIILNPSDIDAILPNEVAYADDVDFISNTARTDIEEISKHLSQFNLKVNPTKTEYTTLIRDENEAWRMTKKVGSLLGDAEDINRRKQLSQAALNKLQCLWKGKIISLKTRMKLYNTLVKSILLYNASTWGMNETTKNGIDAFHRKQLRQILGIRFPRKISNKQLYKKCNEIPISINILKLRWQLFGHILRREQEIPANVAMQFYFTQLRTKKFSGPKRATLPITLNKDLQYLYLNEDEEANDRLKLQTMDDLFYFRELAKNRSDFRHLTSAIVEAAKVCADY